MTIVRSKTSKLHPEEVFRLWIELDTLDKVRGNLAEKGYVNPKTKRPYSKMAIYYNAMKYVLEEPDVAREYYKKYNADYAFDDDIWNEWLIEKAIWVYKNRTRILLWLRRMGLDEKYKYFYADRMGV